ncbi:hypothetical protein MMC12_002881 [Toensbergia leucococca]|nr:hypothetical protein [Toensbergia leucococca]
MSKAVTHSAASHFFVAVHTYLSMPPPSPTHLHTTFKVFKSLRPRSLQSSQIHKPYSTSSNAPRKEPVIPRTHYDFFPQTLPSGPPPKGPFDLDIRQLRREFLQLQAKAHPDMHQGANKARAEGASARINEAYKTLQSPLLRAQYLLSLRGIDVAEDETARVEDPKLLMEVLDMREEIEAAATEEDLVPLKKKNARNIKSSEDVIEGAFSEDDILLAKEEAVRLRYWINIKESLHAWEKGKPIVLQH